MKVSGSTGVRSVGGCGKSDSSVTLERGAMISGFGRVGLNAVIISRWKRQSYIGINRCFRPVKIQLKHVWSAGKRLNMTMPEESIQGSTHSIIGMS